ncbi:hypothetical protein PILCRDRAFT_380395 [Piloderma croceum F 1598]|uniref:Uncharacterized protein n=1 Tax=Piloderma croceum (strain F 1598) TaxID=765440 RepID=A0A0C3G353_PILCF|nr:hypothetical protein PILCRDRAFT_380395 [Piloderma croceum F 1598]
MAENYQIPVIDEHNPFYCPSVSPNSYLATLHKSLSKSNVSAENVSLYSFARILDQKFFDVNEDGSPYHQDHRFYAVAHSGKPISPLPAYSPPSWETQYLPAYPPGLFSSKHEQYPVALDVAPVHVLKRKRSSSSNSFSDLEGPTKHGRSSESIHESSFDISGKAEKIFGSHFYDGRSTSSPIYAPFSLPIKANAKPSGNENDLLAAIRILEGMSIEPNTFVLDPIPFQWNWVNHASDYMRYTDELYGPHLGSETPRGLKQLVHVLDQILPGIGVKKRFYILDNLTHQKIVDVLGNNGQSTIIGAYEYRI